MMNTTHYIPIFTTLYHGQQRAVCGETVNQWQHSAEPSCPACLAYLLAERDEDEETAVALEREFPEFAGCLVSRKDEGR